MPDGEPAGALEVAVLDDTPLPLAVATPLPPSRSLIGASSSTRSRLNGWGPRNVSSRAKRIALWVRFEMRREG